jgi:tyrosinase
LDSAQQEAFIRAMRKLKDAGRFDDLVRFHVKNAPAMHNNPSFLPMHRLMLAELEDELIKLEPSLIAIPYWDWTLDARAPALSPIWDQFGRPVKDRCLDNGAFANWQCIVNEPHCLTRGFTYGDRRLSPLPDAQVMGELVRNVDDFVQFSRRLEYGAHATVHIVLGAEASDFSSMTSPNDPVFFLHHANIDRMYNAWQNTDPKNRLKQYYGTSNYGGDGVSPEDLLHKGKKVKDVLNTLDLCYVYVNPNTNTRPGTIKPPVVIPTTPVAPTGNNTTGNSTLAPLPYPASEVGCKRMGYDVQLVRYAEEEYTKVYKTCDQKVKDGYFIGGIGVNESARPVPGYGCYPPVQIEAPSYQIPVAKVQEIIPSYNSKDGYKYGEGPFLKGTSGAASISLSAAIAAVAGAISFMLF